MTEHDSLDKERFRVVNETAIPHYAGCVVWSPDDRWIAVGGWFVGFYPAGGWTGLTVLDAETWDVRWRGVNDRSCRAIAISPDSQRIAIGTSEHEVLYPGTGITGIISRVRMLDASTGTELWNTVGGGRFTFSPDCTLLAINGRFPQSEGRFSTLVVNAGTGAVLHRQGGCRATPAFSSDSRLLCTGAPALVESRTGALVWQRSDHDGGFASRCAFTPADDGVVVASGRYGTITVFELHLPADLNAERSRVEAPDLSAASLHKYNQICLSPDCRAVAFIADDHVGLNTVADGRRIVQYQIPRPPWPSSWNPSLSFRPDSTQIAVNCAVALSPGEQPTPGVSVIDTATGDVVWREVGPDVTDLAFNHSGSRIASGGADFIRIYEIGAPVRARHDCGARITTVGVSAAAAGIVAAATDGDQSKLVVFRAASGEALLERIHPGVITSVAVHPSGHSVATASSDGRCRHFDTLTGTRWVARHRGPVNAVAFTSDGQRLTTASSDRAIRLFEAQLPAGADPDNHQPIWTRQLPHIVTHIALAPNSEWVATASLDHKVRILAASTGDELHSFEHDAGIRALAVAETGLLASASDDGSAFVIDATSGQRKFRIEHPGPLSLASLSGDGTLLATAGSDIQIHIWQVHEGEATPVHRLAAHAAAISIAFDPASHRLAIASACPVVQIFDPDTGTEIDRLIHPSPVTHLAFGIDGALLATGCEDNHARVYEVGNL